MTDTPGKKGSRKSGVPFRVPTEDTGVCLVRLEEDKSRGDRTVLTGHSTEGLGTLSGALWGQSARRGESQGQAGKPWRVLGGEEERGTTRRRRENRTGSSGNEAGGFPRTKGTRAAESYSLLFISCLHFRNSTTKQTCINCIMS